MDYGNEPYVREEDDFTYVGKGPNAQKLCRLCAAVNINSYGDHHQPSFQALEDSANKCCSLCQLLYHATLNRYREQYDAIGVGPEDIAAWHRKADAYGTEASFTFTRYPFEVLHYARAYFDTNSVKLWPLSIQTRLTDRLKRPAALLYCTDPLGNHSPTVGRILPPYPDFGVFNSWLDMCGGGDHPGCAKFENVEFPTRVIATGILDEPTVRLVEGFKDKGKYVASSHCWGQSKANFKTTKANLQQHLTSIPVVSLPQTLLDAIVATRDLGFRYIWIDSLCIIQDMEADWQQECAKMNSIYENAALTIAAAGASGPEHGFLRFRDYSLSSVLLPGTEPVVLSAYDHYRANDPSEMPESKLNTRAWVLQERLLSPRLLTFGEKEAYFDCSYGCRRELSPYNFHRVGEDFQHLKPTEALSYQSFSTVLDERRQLCDLWQSIVEEYSHCTLTYQSDTLAAVSGIARKIRAQESSVESSKALGPYLAGLWTSSEHLWRCLVFYCAGPAKTYMVKQIPSAPSWSWASSVRPIKYFKGDDFYTAEKPYSLRLLSHSVAPAGLDEYGDVRPGGFLEISTYTLACTRMVNPAGGIILQCKDNSTVEIHVGESDTDNKRGLEQLRVDDPDTFHVSGGPPLNLICACVVVSQGVVTSGMFCYWLVLVASQDERYRRIGLGRSRIGEDDDQLRNDSPQIQEWLDAKCEIRKISIE